MAKQKLNSDQIDTRGSAWTAWTPTFANLTIGNAVVTARYIQLGKTVHFRLAVTLGSTSVVGTNPTFSLPATAAAYGASASEMPLGQAHYLDAGVQSYIGSLYLASTTTVVYSRFIVSGTIIAKSGITATAPFTFGTSDELNVSGTYEAA